MVVLVCVGVLVGRGLILGIDSIRDVLKTTMVVTALGVFFLGAACMEV